jgi:hypothetical protein
MPQVITVRAKKCKGCLYSPTAIASNAKEGRDFFRDHPELAFGCHCHIPFGTTTNDAKVLCRGYYDAHHDRLNAIRAITIRFTKKGGHDETVWESLKPGKGYWGHVEQSK